MGKEMDKLLGIKGDRTIKEKYDAKVYGDILMEDFSFKSNGKKGYRKGPRFGIFLIYTPEKGIWRKNADVYIKYLLRVHYLQDKDQRINKVSKIVNYIRNASLVPEEDMEKILKKQGLEQVKPL